MTSPSESEFNFVVFTNSTIFQDRERLTIKRTKLLNTIRLLLKKIFESCPVSSHAVVGMWLTARGLHYNLLLPQLKPNKTLHQPAPAQLPLPSSQPNLDFYVLESGAPPYLNTATADITTTPTLLPSSPLLL